MKTVFLSFLIGLTMQLAYAQQELKDPYDKGVQLLKAEKYNEAKVVFTEVLSKATNPKLKKFCYIYRAFSYNGLGDFKSAIADFDKAIALDAADLASYTDRGIAKIQVKDLEGAKKDFLHVLSKDSTGKQAEASLYYLAKITYQQGAYEKSIVYYDQLIVLTPKEPELYFNRATAKGMLMNVTGAISDYDKAIELKPDYMEAYANRGVAKINLLTSKGIIAPTGEQTSDACEDLKKAKQLGDNSVDDMIYIHCNKK